MYFDTSSEVDKTADTLPVFILKGLAKKRTYIIQLEAKKKKWNQNQCLLSRNYFSTNSATN